MRQGKSKPWNTGGAAPTGRPARTTTNRKTTMKTSRIMYPRLGTAPRLSTIPRLSDAPLPRTIERSPWGDAAALLDHPSDAPPG